MFKEGGKNLVLYSISPFDGLTLVSYHMHLISFVFKFLAVVIILTFLSLKFSFLFFYHCSDNIVLAISTKQTMFERCDSTVKKKRILVVLC